MERRQLTIVIVALVALIVAVAWAVRVSQEGGLVDSSTTFFARKGAMRDKAQALVAKKQPPPSRKTTRGSRSDLAKVQSVTLLDGSREISDEERVAHEAMNALDPLDGIQRIESYLAALSNMGQASGLYAALGRLYAQTSPPDIERSRAAFSMACDLAPSPEARHRTAHYEVMTLLENALADEALERIRETLAFDEALTVPRMQLTIARGQLLEDKGEADGALATYKALCDLPAEALATLGPKAEDVYRLACLRLAALHRKNGRTSEADAVARRMRERLRLVGSL